MARKVTFKMVSEVTVNIDDGVELCDLDLQLYNEETNADVIDFQITDSEVIDSKQMKRRFDDEQMFSNN